MGNKYPGISYLELIKKTGISDIVISDTCWLGWNKLSELCLNWLRGRIAESNFEQMKLRLMSMGLPQSVIYDTISHSTSKTERLLTMLCRWSHCWVNHIYACKPAKGYLECNLLQITFPVKNYNNNSWKFSPFVDYVLSSRHSTKHFIYIFWLNSHTTPKLRSMIPILQIRKIK